ncbi:FecR domain-containing protein [Flagellatimonas centrodinii]|uniref:FecR family protein n=1 Tax=Flagellatimonas centrodinii TaxID=2806210 RepID=UPI001FED4D37|nr:FecR domain-containing protein [Flagellatimonas centrodinii]ULQ47715.1 FecR domain-containing protein [Flagellatimonas centrodinii]
MKSFGTSSDTQRDRIRLSGDVAQDAAAWSDALRQHPTDAVLRRQFQAWQAVPEHASAFQQVDHSTAQVLAARHSAGITALHSQTLARVAARQRKRHHRVALVAAGLAATVVMGVSAVVLSGGSWAELQLLRDRAVYALQGQTLYHTAAGERLAVNLEDGTQLTLNTDSRVVVAYTDTTRALTLHHGQALFEVAKDPAHPFVVTAGNRTVTALGTAFDVRYQPDRFEVTLVEGKVEVAESAPQAAAKGAAVPTPHPSPLTPHVLTPGQQLLVTTAAPAPVIRPTDTERVTSWRTGQVIFKDDPLDLAVAEINRYGGRTIVLADPALAQLRISGAFNTGNTQGFVSTLTAYFDVHITEATPTRIVLAPRSPDA